MRYTLSVELVESCRDMVEGPKGPGDIEPVRGRHLRADVTVGQFKNQILDHACRVGRIDRDCPIVQADDDLIESTIAAFVEEIPFKMGVDPLFTRF